MFLWHRFHGPAADHLHPPILGLDDLSHRLQEEGTYGYSVIFLLIWITTFRECRVRPVSFLAYPHHAMYSPIAIVLNFHHTLWLHLWGMDRGRYFLLCRTFRSHLCLRPLSVVFSRNDRILAVENYLDQEGGSCDREATKTSVYGSPRTLPV